MNATVQKLMFSSKTDDWATPQDFFDKLTSELGPFDLDVCASEENKKCQTYYNENLNGLAWNWYDTVTWNKTPHCWMNPPYGRTIGHWVKKAYEESLRGCVVVCLLPARTDTKWFHDYCYNKAEIRFVKGRLKFGASKNSAPFPSMVVIFRPKGEVK